MIHWLLCNGFISCCWLSHGLVGCPGFLPAFSGTGPEVSWYEIITHRGLFFVLFSSIFSRSIKHVDELLH